MLPHGDYNISNVREGIRWTGAKRRNAIKKLAAKMQKKLDDDLDAQNKI